MHPSDSTMISSDSPEGWRIERHDHGRLDFVDAHGMRHNDVDVLRAFPVTAAAGPVAIIAADGGELAWVESLADQPAELRTLLERELAQREFLPVIERIEAVSDSEPSEWSVITDRGRHRFKVSHVDDIARHVGHLAPTRSRGASQCPLHTSGGVRRWRDVRQDLARTA